MVLIEVANAQVLIYAQRGWCNKRKVLVRPCNLDSNSDPSIGPWRRLSLHTLLAFVVFHLPSIRRLTLDVSNALLQDLLENLGVLKLLLDLGNDGGSELLLLALLNLTLVTDPRVKDGLGLSGQGSLLLELVSLRLKLGGFLQYTY